MPQSFARRSAISGASVAIIATARTNGCRGRCSCHFNQLPLGKVATSKGLNNARIETAVIFQAVIDLGAETVLAVQLE